jgi:hypothetical protein
MAEAVIVQTVVTIAAAFAGGVLGAAIGAIPTFGLFGAVVVVSEVLNLVQGTLPRPVGGAGASATSTVGITAVPALGPLLGPHTAFAGGVAAAAYACRKGHIDSEFDYYHAKDITFPLGWEPRVLVAGGCFGLVGVLLAELSALAGLPWHPVFMSVVLTGFLHRIAFGYPLLGEARGELLDMSPYERGERRAADGGQPGESRYVVEPWLPEFYQWPRVALIGLGGGLAAAIIAVLSGSPFLAFGISAASLALLVVDTREIPFDVPATHHVTLPAGIAALSVGFGGWPLALVVGTVFGITGALSGELAQRVFYAHADTHLDPPAVAIVINTFIIAGLTIAGILDPNVIPTLGFTPA